MARSYGGTTCPRCKQYARLIDGGKRLGEHRTEFYALGGDPGNRVRERCTYSQSTVKDAAAGIPPLRRKTNDRLREAAKTRVLTASEAGWLARHGIPDPPNDLTVAPVGAGED